MNAVDTNILVYLHDVRDPAKQAIAAALVRSLTNGALIWQVACEYISAAKKLKPLGVTEDEIWQNLRLLRSTWRMLLPAPGHLDRAEILLRLHSLSIWDALLLAVALERGVTMLYSEDSASVGNIPGIRIVNPFLP